MLESRRRALQIWLSRLVVRLEKHQLLIHNHSLKRPDKPKKPCKHETPFHSTRERVALVVGLLSTATHESPDLLLVA